MSFIFNCLSRFTDKFAYTTEVHPHSVIKMTFEFHFTQHIRSIAFLKITNWYTFMYFAIFPKYIFEYKSIFVWLFCFLTLFLWNVYIKVFHLQFYIFIHGCIISVQLFRHFPFCIFNSHRYYILLFLWMHYFVMFDIFKNNTISCIIPIIIHYRKKLWKCLKDTKSHNISGFAYICKLLCTVFIFSLSIIP